MPYLGAHMSIAGGLALAFTRLAQVGGEALQVFVKNQRQWQAPPLKPGDVEEFRRARRANEEVPVAAHNSYLINLAAPKSELVERSIMALADELRRAHLLEIPFLIMHPGSHGGAGIEAGLERLVRHLDRCLSLAGESNRVTILLETPAGQGTGLGASFEELAHVLHHSRYPERLGVCLDTCHVFAAGYDLRTPEAYERTLQQFDRVIGLERLKFFHLNDAKKGLGSRVDRHEHIGMGQIGVAGFQLLLRDGRFADHPMVLETPKDKDLHQDRENLTVLKGLRAC